MSAQRAAPDEAIDYLCNGRLRHVFTARVEFRRLAATAELYPASSNATLQPSLAYWAIKFGRLFVSQTDGRLALMLKH
jgi:hypothetical protein